jgi:hypothetical protein
MQLILGMVVWQVEVRQYVLVGEMLKEGYCSGLQTLPSLQSRATVARARDYVSR